MESLPKGLDKLVPYWVGRLTDAIAHDKFHNEVCSMLVTTMSEAYNRGVASDKKKKRKP
jgi:hypothetical protein